MDYTEYLSGEIVEYIESELQDLDEDTKLKVYREIVKRLNKNSNYNLL